jgi:hypothetical protein
MKGKVYLFLLFIYDRENIKIQDGRMETLPAAAVFSKITTTTKVVCSLSKTNVVHIALKVTNFERLKIQILKK